MEVKTKYQSIELIMLSKFGRSDGGRESWAYNFLPELILEDSYLVTVFGYRKVDDVDNTNDFEFSTKRKNNLSTIILKAKYSTVPRFLGMYISLRAFLKSYPKPAPDIVLVMGILELVIMLICGRYYKSKKIVWLRSVFLNEKAYRIPKFLFPIAKTIEKYLLGKADLILANGDDIQVQYQKYGYDVKVIKNGVDQKKWSMEPPKLSKVIRIAYIGRLSEVKGIEPFFELVKTIKQGKFADQFEFHIVGDSGIYTNKVDKYETLGYVNYHNQISNEKLPTFLNNIDICVALTFSSSVLGGGGTSNALMEQMASSKIIVAWDSPIFRQLLNDENAYLVEQYSVTSLVDILIFIQSHPDDANRKSMNARETMIPYSIESQVNKFKTLLIDFES
jgi:glycosyltransferase involved in cell wall biosynthesis